jgi:hypothetical protein
LEKKFVGYKADGRFGPTTDRVVRGIKAGLGLDGSTSEVTPELFDRIKNADLSKLQGAQTPKAPGFGDFSDFARFEARLVSFDRFGVMEQFDVDAAMKILGDGDGKSGAPRKKITSAGIPKTKKVLSSEEIKRDQEKAKQKIKDEGIAEFIMGQVLPKLKEMGLDKNPDYDKDKNNFAIAKNENVRFFSNYRAIRVFDKQMGTYDLEKKIVNWDDGSKDSIPDLINKKGYVPKKYTEAVFLLYSDLREFHSLNKDLYNGLMKWKPEQISLLKDLYKKYCTSYGIKNADLQRDMIKRDKDLVDGVLDKFKGVL